MDPDMSSVVELIVKHLTHSIH